jgi:hypothetical protein
MMGSTILAAAVFCLGTSGFAAAAAASFELVLALPQRDAAGLEQRFWAIAEPQDEHYLQHLSIEEVGGMLAAADEDVAAARSWLESMGAEKVRVNVFRDTVTGLFESEERVRASKHWDHWSKNSGGVFLPAPTNHSRPLDYILRRDAMVASNDQNALQRPTWRATEDSGRAYDIASQKKAYQMPADLTATNPKTLQMVWGPGTFGYSPARLAAFRDEQCPRLNVNKVHSDGFKGKPGGDNFGEGSLDITMIASFGLNVSTLVSNTNTSMSTEEGSGFGQAMLDFVTSLAERPQLPQVLSLSLGSLSPHSCSLLCTEAAKRGKSLSACQAYMQHQRQVCMYISEAQAARIDTALQVLGARGVSVFGSSGDGGSHWSFGEFPPFDPMGKVLNEIGCEFQFPIYPSPSPYMISVGGTQWADGDGTKPVFWDTHSGHGGAGGGGFAWQWPMPAHQKSTVGKYISGQEAAKTLPPPMSFNAQGRGYPDISAVAVEGTSQSSPTVAGLFSMIMDHRLNAGLPPLGFFAPRLWQAMEKHPGVAVSD